MKLAIIAEYDPSFEPHAQTDSAIAYSASTLDLDVQAQWISTSSDSLAEPREVLRLLSAGPGGAAHPFRIAVSTSALAMPSVIPAQAGIQWREGLRWSDANAVAAKTALGSRLRGNDREVWRTLGCRLGGNDGEINESAKGLTSANDLTLECPFLKLPKVDAGLNNRHFKFPANKQSGKMTA